MKLIVSMYKETFVFFKEKILKYFIFSAILFIGVCVIAHFSFLRNQELAKEYINILIEAIKNKNVIDTSGNISVFKLFLNNFQATTISCLLGFLPFSYLAVVVVLIPNSVIIGAFSSYLIVGGGSAASLFASLIPHGIFELSAVFLATGLSIYLCSQISGAIFRRNKSPLSDTIAKVFLTYIAYVLPLLIIAAFVETYLTPIIMNLV